MTNVTLFFPFLQEIQSLDNKIHETVETINTMKIQREFFLSFAKDPQLFINKWIISQSRGNLIDLNSVSKLKLPNDHVFISLKISTKIMAMIYLQNEEYSILFILLCQILCK